MIRAALRRRVAALAGAVLAVLGGAVEAAAELGCGVPGVDWRYVEPAEVGLEREALRRLAELVRGAGVVVRHGSLASRWGRFWSSSDVASAAKPVVSALLLTAVREGRIGGLDEPLARFVPELAALNGGVTPASPGAISPRRPPATARRTRRVGILLQRLGDRAPLRRPRRPGVRRGPARALQGPVRPAARLRGLDQLPDAREGSPPPRAPVGLAARLRALRPALPPRRPLGGARAPRPGAGARGGLARRPGRAAGALRAGRADALRAALDLERRPPAAHPRPRGVRAHLVAERGRRAGAPLRALPPGALSARGHSAHRMLAVVPEWDLVVSWNSSAEPWPADLEARAMALLAQAVGARAAAFDFDRAVP